ncbi:MAG: nitrogenase component 1 [Bacillota bacterium]|nr:nitrogenase component 1 [Bacillota bacterium]
MSNESINLNANTCPNRESRIHSIKAYYGDADTLIDETLNKKVKWRNRAFQQSGGCVLTAGVQRLSTVRNAIILNHAPIGCAGQLYGYRELYKSIPPEFGIPQTDFRWISSNLKEEDIVFGGEKKLKDTIIEADERYKPEAIFIINSCASGIMGDDIEGVVTHVQPKVNAILVPIHCEGFRSQVPQTGFDAFWHGILKYIVQKPKQKQEDLVNIIAPFSVTWGDRREIKRILEKINIRVNFVPELSTISDLKQLSEAALTLTTCGSYGDYLQKSLYQEYGIPYIRNEVPIGISQTSDWLRKVAKITNRSELAEKVIKEEEEALKPQIENLQKLIANINPRIFISAGQARALGLPLLAADLGIEISGISTLEHDDLSVENLQKIKEKCGGKFKIHVGEYQSFEQSAIIHEIKPHIYTGCPMGGSVYKREAGIGRMHSFRSDFTVHGQQFGYQGVINYGFVLLKALSNPSLNKKIGEFTPSPYKKWWHEKGNPLTYVKEA